MEINIKDLVLPVNTIGQVMTHRDTSKEGAKEYSCSTFIRKKNVLVKGERKNLHEDKRNAMILLFDTESGDILGGSRTYTIKVIERQRTDIIQQACVLCRPLRVERPGVHNRIR